MEKDERERPGFVYSLQSTFYNKEGGLRSHNKRMRKNERSEKQSVKKGGGGIQGE